MGIVEPHTASRRMCEPVGGSSNLMLYSGFDAWDVQPADAKSANVSAKQAARRRQTILFMCWLTWIRDPKRQIVFRPLSASDRVAKTGGSIAADRRIMGRPFIEAIRAGINIQ